jgi:hypothetical protein
MRIADNRFTWFIKATGCARRWCEGGVLLQVDDLYESYPPVKVRTEIRTCFAVLTLRTHADAVGEYGFEAIEIGAHDVNALIRHQPHQVLSHSLVPDASLTKIYGEAFFQQNGSNVS